MQKRKLGGLRKSRSQANSALARRMWKFYMKHGWWKFLWPGMQMHEAVERATS